MTRACLCDVPGCGRTRKRWQRLCDRCFAKLPGEIRTGIKEAKHERRNKDWQALRRRAAAFLNLDRNPAQDAIDQRLRRIPPDQAFDLQARMLGERTDP